MSINSLEIKMLSSITKNQIYKNGIHNLIIMCDKEFIPPLSTRKSTSQKDLLTQGETTDDYFQEIEKQPTLISVIDEQVVGFMSFKENYKELTLPNIYVTTIIVNPNIREHGIAKLLYHALFESYKNYHIFTRTWSTNIAHIKILTQLGFEEYIRKENDRGNGIDTIYFHYENQIKR